MFSYFWCLKLIFTSRYGDVEFPYKERVIFAFQKTEDDLDVAYFALRAQEYGNDCPAPNRGHVYLSYIDSIKVYEPSTIRTQVSRTQYVSSISGLE